jgi:hypothetical protein
VDERNLLFQRHLFDEQIGPLVRRQTLVEPGAFNCLVGGLIRTLRENGRQGHA